MSDERVLPLGAACGLNDLEFVERCWPTGFRVPAKPWEGAYCAEMAANVCSYPSDAGDGTGAPARSFVTGGFSPSAVRWVL